ncbi:alternative ribosome-rescue factor A [Photobacterium swingsii]|uniref:Ribosome alternative rescue factor ArfA n=1 Tax=Photobacterium swingsii TaxID=680026 RepID=A0A2T3P9J7_9GAMM|nr:ribosome alternative rescue factor ArfA [Photobacterium swingsii]PSW25531.1 ribosome alternative rescue factor ArfA [Photobacterium swingsii]
MVSKKRKVKLQARNSQEADLVQLPTSVNNTAIELGRGTIQDNALKAAVTSKLFTTRVVKAKKGKGSFSRKDKFKGREPYSMVFAVAA